MGHCLVPKLWNEGHVIYYLNKVEWGGGEAQRKERKKERRFLEKNILRLLCYWYNVICDRFVMSMKVYIGLEV